jgi:hypothetical protein
MKAIAGALLILAGAVLIAGSLIAQAMKPNFQFGALSEAPRDLSICGLVIAAVGVVLVVYDLAAVGAVGNKVVKTCPYCGAAGTKELVVGPKKINWIVFAAILLLAPIGIVLVPLWYRPGLVPYCDKCSRSFPT